MKLYEINNSIQELLSQLEPDPETGEVTGDIDSVVEQLNALEMQKSSVLEYLAKVVLDTRAGVTALKDEEKRLKERRQALERKDERLMAILDRECAGQKTDCGVATVCYRKTSRLEVDDSHRAVDWLISNGHVNCYRVPDIEISKAEVKKLVQTGAEVPGVSLVQDMSCSLR